MIQGLVLGVFLGLLFAGICATKARRQKLAMLKDFIAENGLTQEIGEDPTVFEMVGLYSAVAGERDAMRERAEKAEKAENG